MYAATPENQERGGPLPAGDGTMAFQSFTHAEYRQRQRKFSEDLPSIFLHRPLTHPQTPPESTSGSPRIKFEGDYPRAAPPRVGTEETWHPLGSLATTSRDCSPLPGIARLNSPRNTSVRLPSLEEFDQGVEALARSHGPPRPYTPPSPLSSLTRCRPFSQLPRLSPHRYSYHVSDPFTHDTAGMDGYPSPPLDGENRHINQKYTTEEGDFIIYAWHDKKLKWQRIKQDFAAMFGRTPERTVQGLQAWYYRMNQRIPVWDQDGWLVFDNEDDLEPRYVSIKCRERDSHDKPMEPLGLAQRYPERAIHYSWVDPQLKQKSQDWAAKRALQYRERRERRKRKEQRRLKL
ncbi:hypothetical protein DCS_04815 [Drechmeria coniospora]|uniref:Uncharacterized protein n=1 Tax=Drechmeria coniospora TaxID=98403 RepID=A0A151GLC4_DRECN|nr:hypothetical protein DCS_04815 [Drechmeria coniospora]KYK57802.1 hypothetical protein DCS_04815 [Drechmeria coniospora]ODA82789.1 hypothetical protein RJ55_01298 [Drechmeria coniospora]